MLRLGSTMAAVGFPFTSRVNPHSGEFHACQRVSACNNSADRPSHESARCLHSQVLVRSRSPSERFAHARGIGACRRSLAFAPGAECGASGAGREAVRLAVACHASSADGAEAPGVACVDVLGTHWQCFPGARWRLLKRCVGRGGLNLLDC